MAKLAAELRRGTSFDSPTSLRHLESLPGQQQQQQRTAAAGESEKCGVPAALQPHNGRLVASWRKPPSFCCSVSSGHRPHEGHLYRLVIAYSLGMPSRLRHDAVSTLPGRRRPAYLGSRKTSVSCLPPTSAQPYASLWLPDAWPACL
ncbi:uncharacterized protein A4U43_C02F22770 [Asparagus officinalis]|uniref:Uncharacterized protein n=1 Tax=Asparagus officinalis TaxID=4686 RepID=A0A5P1FQ79_ASPOF|nr:uncharacterized protein A4U43_C02F22770 [Asparagus officinalis]